MFSISYLGIPAIHCRRLTNTKYKYVEKRLHKQLSSWKGKFLSLDRSLVLINLVLTNMVPYIISFFQLPKGVLHRLGSNFRSRFLWDSKKWKNILEKYSVVYWPKDQRGLKIYDLKVKNRALLSKWLYKLLTKDWVWIMLLRRK
jgi:hypothetical protein